MKSLDLTRMLEVQIPAHHASSESQLDDLATASQSASLINQSRSIRRLTPVAPSDAAPRSSATREPEKSHKQRADNRSGDRPLVAAPRSRGILRRPSHVFENMSKRSYPAVVVRRADPYAIEESPVKKPRARDGAGAGIKRGPSSESNPKRKRVKIDGGRGNWLSLDAEPSTGFGQPKRVTRSTAREGQIAAAARLRADTSADVGKPHGEAERGEEENPEGDGEPVNTGVHPSGKKRNQRQSTDRRLPTSAPIGNKGDQVGSPMADSGPSSNPNLPEPRLPSDLSSTRDKRPVAIDNGAINEPKGFVTELNQDPDTRPLQSSSRRLLFERMPTDTPEMYERVNEELDDETQWLGQRQKLKEVFAAVSRVGCRTVKKRRITEVPKLQTEAIRNLRGLCSKLIIMYHKLPGLQGDQLELANDRVEKLAQKVGERLDAILRNEAEDETESLIQDIYAHGLPSLIRLLEEILESCSGEGHLEGNDLRTVSNMIFMILELGTKAQEAQEQPRDLGLLTVTKNKILKPLREVQTAFENALEAEKERKAKAGRMQRASQLAQERERKEKAERRVVEEKRAIVGKWQDLHFARMKMEPDPRRRLHLRYKRPRPPETSEELPDIDANGEPFERVEIFAPRSTPPAHASRSAEVQGEWADNERLALLEGLERFTGPNVFERIFKDYCGLQGSLRRFSVDEITREAAYLKDILMTVAARKGRNTDEWVTAIPTFEPWER